MNHLLTPQWLGLKDAVAYLAKATNTPWTIAEVLELGRVGKLPMYAVIRPDTGVSCWPESAIKEKSHRWDSERVITFETNPHFEPFKALDFPLVAPQKIAEIQGYGEASGYEVPIEVPAPNGFTYDHPVLPISMDARGVTIKSYEAIRVKGKELEAFISKEQSAEAVDGMANKAPVNKFTPLVDVTKYRGTKRRILELWVDIRALHPSSYDATQVMRVLNRNLGDGGKKVTLKTIQNRLGELQAAGVLP